MRLVDQIWDHKESSHFYSLGSNIGPEFVIGNLGSPDDFWLHGGAVPQGCMTPLLTGRILANDGSVLIEMVMGSLQYEPARCRQIFSETKEGLSYQIQDSKGHVVLQVDTIFSHHHGKLVTSVCGRFFNKAGEIAFDSTRGHLEVLRPQETNVRICSKEHGIPCSAFGREFLVVLMESRGAIRHILTGRYEGVELDLSGAMLADFYAKNCDIIISEPFWMAESSVHFDAPNTVTVSGAVGAVLKVIENCRKLPIQ